MKLLATWPLAALLLAPAAPASAQSTVHLGLRGGALRTKTTLDPTANSNNLPAYSYSASKSALIAWQAGLVLEASLGRFALQPALLFTQKGDHSEASYYMGDLVGVYGEATRTLRTNWLELPVHVVYTWHGVQVFGGPYVALALGGRQRGTAVGYSSTNYTTPYAYDQPVAYGPGGDSRRLDAGLDAGVGYRLGAWQAQLGCQLGLRNLHQAAGGQRQASSSYWDVPLDAAYTRGWQLSGTYFFAGSSK